MGLKPQKIWGMLKPQFFRLGYNAYKNLLGFSPLVKSCIGEEMNNDRGFSPPVNSMR